MSDRVAAVTAFFNDTDPYVAAWLRNLIAAGHIAPGVVDERSIADLDPDELARYTQCHFFAGIGVWSYALRLAGWPDDRPVWTGSCPCQPFSAAGKGAGIADERHLWPAWFRLIRERRPVTVFGEQVGGRAGIDWLAAVHLDLQADAYAFGAAALPACSVGAPHIRERLFFVAHADGAAARQHARELPRHEGEHEERAALRGHGAERGGAVGSVADAARSGLRVVERVRHLGHAQSAAERAGEAGFWSDCAWLPCRDGKARPVEPGTFPLAHGAPARVGRLRGYGNALVAPVAQAFIEAAVAAIGDQR